MATITFNNKNNSCTVEVVGSPLYDGIHQISRNSVYLEGSNGLSEFGLIREKSSNRILFRIDLANDSIIGLTGNPTTLDELADELDLIFFLDASGNGGGVPNLSNAQRDALTNVPLGYQIYNTDSDEIQYRVDGGWYCTKIMHIGTGSVDTIVVTNDDDNPSFITGFVLSGSVGLELIDAATGTFENKSGRLIMAMTGTISFRPEETGGGTGELQICSERSTDGGATYTITPISLRTIEVPANGESFSTKVSFISNLQPNERFRFLLLETGPGGITISPTTETIKGQVITSPSVIFEITEQGTIIEDAP